MMNRREGLIAGLLAPLALFLKPEPERLYSGIWDNLYVFDMDQHLETCDMDEDCTCCYPTTPWRFTLDHFTVTEQEIGL